MRHNTVEILDQLAKLAKKYPFKKPEYDEAERLIEEFEGAILRKLSPIVAEKSVPRQIGHDAPSDEKKKYCPYCEEK